MSLRTSLGTASGKSRYTRRLFATIADRYDLITILLSYGQDRRWKKRLGALARVQNGERALDLACGTGDLAFEIAGRGARVVGLDITFRMIELARAKPQAAASFVVGDMMTLPFPDRSFELVTSGYGIRNVPVIETAVREIYRVLGPGGRLLSLDFNRPENAWVRSAYLLYLTIVGSTLGFALHGDPDTYRYIPETIRRYPGSRWLTDLMPRIGFVEAGHVPLLGGLMAINTATKGFDSGRS